MEPDRALPRHRRADLPERLLLVSCSARMLAQSAARAGIRAIALDQYGDADTRAYADTVSVIPTQSGNFDRQLLLDRAARLAPAADYPLVYGSGLDSRPDLLEALAQTREMIGNSPRVQRLFREPRRFFDLLNRLGIPHPDIRYEPPQDPERWLIKCGCSEGGKRVRSSALQPAGPEEYYQRRLEGPAFSALFLADGQRAAVIGFNTLWTVERADRPFLFAGAINHAAINETQRSQVVGHVEKLAEATHIRGLNSLDFMVGSAGQPLVIEINARPSATLALYDEDYAEGLLAAHLRACRGLLTAAVPATKVRGFRVMLTPARMTVTPAARWPEGSADLPVIGAAIDAGLPLCTLGAAGATPGEVLALLQQRTAELLRAQPLSS